MADINFYTRPVSGSSHTERFIKCDEIRITARGTGVSIVGFLDGKPVTQLDCDHPSMAVDAMRQAFHDYWAESNGNISRQIDDYYAKGGRNWSGD